MAAISFTDLYNEILPDIGSYPEPLALRRLYRGAHVFCRRAECWRHAQTQAIVADQEDYTLSLPTNGQSAKLKRIYGVWYGENSADKIGDYLVNTDMYFLTYPLTLKFYAAYPDAVADGLTTEIVLLPDLDELATRGPSDQVMDMWGLRGFAAWAVWDICRQKNRPWSDPDVAEENRLQFLRAISEARTENLKQFKMGDTRVVPRPFV